ncbi:MAG: hypothetical protein WCI22_09415 [Actinomycetota bacterium]
MTDRNTTPEAVDAQLDRLQQLQRRRSAAAAPTAPASSSGKTHRMAPATGAKIATAGFFTATMFGMVGAMSFAQHATSTATNNTAGVPADATLPATTAAPTIIVVVHHVDANGNPIAATKAGTAAPRAGAAPVALPVTTQPPIALTARPVIQQAPAQAAAPVARSSGSRR